MDHDIITAGAGPALSKACCKRGWLASARPLDHHKLEGHPLHCFHPRDVFSAPRVLLVGDAAGVGSLPGEGISFALGYGEVATRELRDTFTRNDFSFEA